MAEMLSVYMSLKIFSHVCKDEKVVSYSTSRTQSSEKTAFIMAQ